MKRTIYLTLMMAVLTLIGTPPSARGDKEKEIAKSKATNAILTPDGKTLIASGNGNIRIMDLAANKSRRLSDTPGNIALSGDGQTVATVVSSPGAEQDTVTVYDVASGKPKSQFAVPNAGVLTFGLTADGKQLFHGTLSDLVLIDTAKGQVKNKVKAGSQPFSVAASADGKFLACGTGAKGIAVFDLATQKPTRTLDLPKYVQSVAFSPDSKLLAGSAEDIIKIWEAESGKETKSLAGTAGKIVRSLAFGKDGKVLASGCSDGSVVLWSLPDGKVLDTIKLGKDVFHVSLSADGTVLSASMEGGETKIFDVSAAVGK